MIENAVFFHFPFPGVIENAVPVPFADSLCFSKFKKENILFFLFQHFPISRELGRELEGIENACTRFPVPIFNCARELEKHSD